MSFSGNATSQPIIYFYLCPGQEGGIPTKMIKPCSILSLNSLFLPTAAALEQGSCIRSFDFVSSV